MAHAAKNGKDVAKLTSLAFIFGRFVREGARTGRDGNPASLLRFEVLHYAKGHDRPTMHDIGNYLCITPPATTLLST